MKTTCKIVVASLCSCYLLLAQTPRWDFEAEEHDPLVPIAEREWSRAIGRPIPTITMPPQEQQFNQTGTVSIRSLQKPISPKSRKLVEKAEDQLKKQDYAGARKTLDSALVLEDARPYALAISGSMHLTEFIRGNRDPQLLSASLTELKEASPLIPSDVGAHSNLGLAYYFTGNLDLALAEASRALQLDPARAKTRYVVGMILCGQRRYPEAVFHLKQAASEIPAARDLLPDIERLAASTNVAQQ